MHIVAITDPLLRLACDLILLLPVNVVAIPPRQKTLILRAVPVKVIAQILDDGTGFSQHQRFRSVGRFNGQDG